MARKPSAKPATTAKGGLPGTYKEFVRLPKGTVLTFASDTPRKGYDDVERSRWSYRILHVSPESVRLLLNGETRQTPQGKPVEWELVLTNPTTYRWRALHTSAGAYNEVIGKRCGQGTR